MKKRILLSMASCFAATAMWASLTEAYQIYATAATVKAGTTAELTLNMKNRNAIGTWTCDLVLPAGMSVAGVTVVDARYPEGYEAEITTTAGEGFVTITCEGADGVALTGTDGAIATVKVTIDKTVAAGDYKVEVANMKLVETNGTIHTHATNELTWTIEEAEAGGITGDVNGDGGVDVGDIETVLDAIANGGTTGDVNGDGSVDVGDIEVLLNIIAGN